MINVALPSFPRPPATTHKAIRSVACHTQAQFGWWHMRVIRSIYSLRARAPPPKVYPASTNRDGKKYLHVVARILFLVFHLNWSAWFLQLCFAKNFPQLCSGTDTGTFSGPPRKRLASMLCSGTRWLAAGLSLVAVTLGRVLI